jgi:arylsulfatase A-like enzyme
MCPLSSQYPLRENEIHVYPEFPEYPRVLIYDVLKQFGYRTAVFSSQNENWGQMINYLSTDHLDRLLHAASYSGPTYVCPEDVGFFEWVQGGKKCGKIDDRLTIEEAIHWIEEDPAKPFCMYVNLQNSHIPYVVPPDVPRRFSQAAPDFTIGFNNFPKEKVDQVRNAYADSLDYVDSQIGRLVDFLQESGQWDKTILVISGDTGQAFYEHGFAAHANKLYDEVMRVPLIIHAPDLGPRKDESLAQHIDVPPTILDLLNLPSHPAFQGRSLLEPPNPLVPVFLVVQSPLAEQVAVVQGGYKLIYDLPTQRFHLYDLAVDPQERLDIASRQSEIVREMAVVLRKWCELQLNYYADVSAQNTQYPPVLELQ